MELEVGFRLDNVKIDVLKLLFALQLYLPAVLPAILAQGSVGSPHSWGCFLSLYLVEASSS